MNAVFDRLLVSWWEWVVAVSWQLAVWIALVTAVAWLARRASPRVRYALWFLVLVKVFLPPSLAVSWGVGTWGLHPAWQRWQSVDQPAMASRDSQPAVAPEEPAAVMSSDVVDAGRAGRRAPQHPLRVLFFLWLVGCVGMWLTAVWQYYRLRRSTALMERVEEGPYRVELERLALEMNEATVPELYLSNTAASPFLFGLFCPRIVVPRELFTGLSRADLRSVLVHELNHWRRRDLWVGWLQVIAQSLLWFHPLMWWANARLRHERECACDERVLRTSACDPTAYGQTLLHVLSAVRGKTLVQRSLVGVFEPGANLQQRMEEIMNFQPDKSKMSKWWYSALAVLAMVFLPMSAVTSATSAQGAEQQKMPAWIVATSPEIGATDVDPGITEITVTFDRDMDTSGYSWTGGPPLFPPTDDGGPRWKDSRTCALPVSLAAGEYYRVGINATSFHNFRSSVGQPAPCTAIYFTTKGASKAVESRVRKPEIVKMVPENGATDVDPKTKALRVSFNVPMGGGMSWTGGGDTFPEPREGKQAKWSGNSKTCTLPVTLRPDHAYRIGINSLSHINFQSKWGVPVEPVVYEFRTAASDQANSPADEHLRDLVEEFFKHNFRDVTQRKTIEWGPAEKVEGGNYAIRYKYYASIWDKKLMVMNQVFTFTPEGEFIAWVNVEGFPKTMIGQTSIPEDK